MATSRLAANELSFEALAKLTDPIRRGQLSK